MKFEEAGYDAAINALQVLGLPTVDKDQPAIHLTSEPLTIYPPYQHGLQPPQAANLLPSPNFTGRPYTSSSSEYRPYGSAPEFHSARPYTAPQPVSFSQTLPPPRVLPSQMQLPASAITTPFKAPENPRLGAVEPEQPSAKPPPKPPAKKRAQAKTTKPKAVKNLAPSKAQKTQTEAVSLLSSSPTEARNGQAQAKGGEPPNPAIASGCLVQSPGLDPAADGVGTPLLAGPRTTGPAQRSTDDGPENAAASDANAIVPSKNTTDTSPRNVLVLRYRSRHAVPETSSNSDHPASASTAIPNPAPPPNAEEISAEEFMSALDRFIRDYHQHLPAPEPRPTAADDLAAYAAQPDEVRQAIVKDMVLDLLGDENFAKLAEDMSREWRRIGLGL